MSIRNPRNHKFFTRYVLNNTSYNKNKKILYMNFTKIVSSPNSESRSPINISLNEKSVKRLRRALDDIIIDEGDLD